MKKIMLMAVACVLSVVACQKKEDTGPGLAACTMGMSEMALETTGKTEISLRSMPSGTLVYTGADFYVQVARQGKESQLVHMATNPLAVTSTCGNHVTREETLPNAMNAIGVAAFSQDPAANYSYLKAIKFSISQNDQGVLFNVAPATPVEVPTHISVYELLQSWNFKIYLVSPTSYDIRAVRQLGTVSQTLVVHYQFSTNIMTDTAACPYTTSPIPMDMIGVPVHYKDLPAGTLKMGSADFYVLSASGGSIHIRENAGDLSPAVNCASGLAAGRSYNALGTGITDLIITKDGGTLLIARNYIAGAASYVLTKKSEQNMVIAANAPADAAMAQLWAGNYRLYKISDTSYELRAKYSPSIGDEFNLAIKYAFAPAK